MHALEACDIPQAFDRHLHFDGKTLDPPSSAAPEVDLKFRSTATKNLRHLIRQSGHDHARRLARAAAAKDSPARRLLRARYSEETQLAHPLFHRRPSAAERRFASQRRAKPLKLLKRAPQRHLRLLPHQRRRLRDARIAARPEISLDDTIAFHETLVASGATITEINTVRKYFSAVKGGRLAIAAPEAEKLSLLLADVPLKDLGSVASSPTLPDLSTPQDCCEILDRFHLLEKFPPSVRDYFESLSSRCPAGAGSCKERSILAHAIRHPSFKPRLRERRPRSRSVPRLPRGHRQHLRRLGLRDAASYLLGASTNCAREHPASMPAFKRRSDRTARWPATRLRRPQPAVRAASRPSTCAIP